MITLINCLFPSAAASHDSLSKYTQRVNNVLAIKAGTVCILLRFIVPSFKTAVFPDMNMERGKTHLPLLVVVVVITHF